MKTSKSIVAEITNTFNFGLDVTYETGRRWKPSKREITNNGVSVTMGHGITATVPWTHCKLVEVTKATNTVVEERIITV
jgi:hypothetical protein